MSRNLVIMWHKKFQDGSTELKNGPRPGHPKTGVTNANVAAVASPIKQDTRLTAKYIAYSVGISSGSVCKILTALKT